MMYHLFRFHSNLTHKLNPMQIQTGDTALLLSHVINKENTRAETFF